MIRTYTVLGDGVDTPETAKNMKRRLLEAIMDNSNLPLRIEPQLSELELRRNTADAIEVRNVRAHVVHTNTRNFSANVQDVATLSWGTLNIDDKVTLEMAE